MDGAVPDYQSRLAEATAQANAADLAAIDVSVPERFRDQLHWPWFDRLRREAPVHYCRDSAFGPYWSVTSWDTVVAVNTNPDQFSSYEGGIFIGDIAPGEQRFKSFITADEPEHSHWRKPMMPGVIGDRLAPLEAEIQARAAEILDGLPVGEEFDWVDRVSIELTTQLLAILFDFPWEERRTLTFWSDAVTSTPRVGAGGDMEERQKILFEMHERLASEIRERRRKPPTFDFLSLMAHSPNFADVLDDPHLLIGTASLLIVGGNDTTRNSLSGGLHALNQFPDQYDRLIDNPDLVTNMVKEIIRWQTPLAHMRRTALEDVEVAGHTIRQGEKVVMWYISANRDESKFPDPYEFQIDRKKARHSTSFGYGIHRCMGAHVAEMQLKAIWNGILERFGRIEIVGAPVRTTSNFVMGFETMPVVIQAKH